MKMSNETVRYIAFGCLFVVTAGTAIGAHMAGCPSVVNAAVTALGTVVGFFLGRSQNGSTALKVVMVGLLGGLLSLSTGGCNKVRLDPACAAKAAMTCAAELARCCTINPDNRACLEAVKGGDQ
jgi:hypothetical protein